MPATTVDYANLVLKDKDGNVAYVKSLTANDISKINQVITDASLIVDSSTHELIMASTTVDGAVRLATDTDITNSDTSKVVTAAQLKAVKDATTNGVHYKGTVATYSALPTLSDDPAPIAGDMYNVTAAFSVGGIDYPAGTNVVASITGDPEVLSWDVLEGDPTGFAKKAVANTYTAANDFTAGSIKVPDPETDTTDAGYEATAAINVGTTLSLLDGAIEDIISYSATTPTVANLDNNTITFYEASDLLS